MERRKAVTQVEMASAGVGVVLLLVGGIYRDIMRRIGRVETQYDEISPLVISIAADVKHIREHCSHCMEGK